MKQVTHTIKAVGVTKEGYIFLQCKYYKLRGKVMSDEFKERLKRRYVADLGSGWHRHYNGDMGFTCAEVKAMLTEKGLPYKEVEDIVITDIYI